MSVEAISAEKHLSPTVNFFFVHPAPWMREETFPIFIRSEIPVYGVDRIEYLPRLCLKFPGSVFYIHADSNAAPEHDVWPGLLGSLAEPLIRSKSTVIFLARGFDPAHRETMSRLGIRLGFMELNQASRTMTSQIHAVASKLSQHSRRRAIRVGCGSAGLASFNVHLDNSHIRGHIKDISSSGMAAFVPDDHTAIISEGMDLPKLQMKLRGNLILVDATLVAIRQNAGQSVWVVLFNWGEDRRSKLRIQEFISSRLQEEMDEMIR